jgi:hypothetical protein
MQTVSPANAEARVNRSAEWTAGASTNPTFVTPQLQHIANVWEERRGLRSMPARSSLTLRDLACALPQLSIVDVVTQGYSTRFKVRLMGSELDQILAPMTGRFIDEAVPPPHSDRWASFLSGALKHRAPIRALSRAEYRDRRLYLVEALVAPLADDGENADKVLIACFYHLYQGLEGKPSSVVARLTHELGLK